MENRYWRLLGMFLICLVAFGIGYSYGFIKGGNETFDFFMGFIDYSVDNGILKIEVDAEQLENYLRLAQQYCYGYQSGSAGKVIDCTAQNHNSELPTSPRKACELKNGTYEWSPLDSGYCYLPNGEIREMNAAGGFL